MIAKKEEEDKTVRWDHADRWRKWKWSKQQTSTFYKYFSKGQIAYIYEEIVQIIATESQQKKEHKILVSR